MVEMTTIAYVYYAHAAAIWLSSAELITHFALKGHRQRTSHNHGHAPGSLRNNILMEMSAKTRRHAISPEQNHS